MRAEGMSHSTMKEFAVSSPMRTKTTSGSLIPLQKHFRSWSSSQRVYIDGFSSILALSLEKWVEFLAAQARYPSTV